MDVVHPKEEAVDDVSGTSDPSHAIATSARRLSRSLDQHGAFQAAVLLIGSTCLSLLFWPGLIDADALRQMGEAASGKFIDWWAPILDWFWRPLFLLHLSPGFVVWVTITVFLFSVYELLRLVFARWPAVGVTFLIAAFPPVLGYVGALSRDAWFGTSALACYALLGRAKRTTGRQSLACVLGAFAAAWVALAARQNAFPALIPAFFIATSFLLSGPLRRLRKPGHGLFKRRVAPFLLRVLLPLLLLFLFVVSQRALTYDVIHARHTYIQQLLFDFDLAGLSLRTGHVLLPRDVFPSQSLAVLHAHYSPYTSDALIGGGSPLVGTSSGSVESHLQSAWIHAILSHPLVYLHERWKVWTREIAWSGPADEPFHNGIDRNLSGLRPTFPVLNRFVLRYLRSFTTGPPLLEGGDLYRVWGYIVACSIVGLDLLRRRRPPALRTAGWMCCGAVVYFLPFFFISPGPPFRWAWFLCTVTVIALCLDVGAHVGGAIERQARAVAGELVGAEAPSRSAT